MAIIPLTVLRTNNTDYYATIGKPSIKSVAIPDDLSAVISSIKSATTVWSTAAGSLPGGCSITLTRPNDAYPEVIWVAETMPQIQTALSKATNVTNLYATESAAVTPHSGGGQGSAVLLTKYFSTTSPNADNDSVLLPLAASSTNLVFLVNNGAAAHITAVFPSTGDIINSLAANTALAVAAGAQVYFWSNGVQWYSCAMVS
jgi:hypothetical protein